MLISKIKKLNSHKVFRHFHWPTELLGFSRYNLIFGWNGTGKTTLSNLFRAIEKKSDISDGTVEFEVVGRSFFGSSISAEVSLPQVRVFNRDFVSQSVFVSGGEANVRPIYYLGEESAEKQQKVQDLKLEIENKKKSFLAFENSNQRATKETEKFIQDQARIIKAELSSSGDNIYNNYDRRIFVTSIDRVTHENRAEMLRSEESKSSLRLKTEARPKEGISLADWSSPNWEKLLDDISRILGQTVVSQVLAELSDPELSGWVNHGLHLHTRGNSTEACHFCGNILSPNRIKSLQNHFNDEFSRLQSSIRTKIAEVESLGSRFPIKLPDKAAFHSHLVAHAENDLKLIYESIDECLKYIQAVKIALESKRDKPFESISDNLIQNGLQPPGSILGDRINSLNSLINQHNTQNENIRTIVSGARKELEMAFVAEVWPELLDKLKAVEDSGKSAKNSREEILQLEQIVVELERVIVDHRRSAEELNADLSSYLGRSELQFTFDGTGYSVYRNGTPAQHLSEGEKTAVAFLYFLKSLDDKEFKKESGIVVIDDPVSSLDTSSLFCAFGFMRTRTKDVGQLILLTHNSSFFRQVKNWFHHLEHQNKRNLEMRPGRFYMVTVDSKEGIRSGKIQGLDPLLEKFESDYHYLFSEIFKEAGKPDSAGLESRYGLPNTTRRLLEAFLAFRLPGSPGDLNKKLDACDFNPAKKSRIIRFLHTFSHNDTMGDPDHDPSILSEAPSVLKDVLNLIEKLDPEHYSGMIKAITPATEVT